LAVVWVVLAGEGLAIVLTLAPGIDGDHWIHFGLTSLVVQWVTLLSLGSLYLARRPLARLRPQTIAYVALAMLLLCTWLVGGLAWLLLRGLWPMADGGWQALQLRLTGIVLTVGVLGLAVFQNHWRARQLAVRTKQAELDALHARIRPHFLFNTLNTGAALIHQRPGEAERLLLDLADLFRAALGGPREILLADELSLTRRYLEIEGLRLGDRLRVSWQLPDGLPDIDVPALSIQPLVENAVRHGVEPSPTGGDISIHIDVDSNHLRIVVSNSIPPHHEVRTRGHGIGLNSARERIAALPHGAGRLDTTIEEGRYTATVTLPNG
jgi:two-component system sensor histidine kinase AlgZ